MKPRVVTIIASLLLAIPCMAEDGTSCAYWPARESSWIRYQVFRIGAYWHRDGPASARQLSVVWREYSYDVFVQIQWVDSPSTFPVKSFDEKFMRDIDYPKVGERLGNIVFSSVDGRQYIGEMGSVGSGFIVVPPEPKIPIVPAGGEALHTYHRVMYPEGTNTRASDLITRYYTIGHPMKWGHHIDCWWTSLEEVEPSTGATRAIYNYVFARGIGLVNFWYCAPYSEIPGYPNMSFGWEAYAVDWMP